MTASSRVPRPDGPAGARRAAGSSRAIEGALDALAILAALAAVAAYAAGAAQLVRYPWDWGPDEGLTLDYARRLVHAPESLFARTVVPVPIGYPPLLAALLVPFVETLAHPLSAARLLACVWTALIVVSVYVLVRREGSPRFALLAAALVLAPLDLSFWYLLIRPDGLMIALWLTSAVVLLPRQLKRGAARLSWPRAVGGGLVLLCAVLAKPTAILHGAPLVLGWWLVDRASAWRLGSVVGAGGLGVVAALQLASDGGFFWVLRLWGVYTRQPGLATLIILQFIQLAGLVIVFALSGLLAGWRARREADPALLLLAGGLLALPALARVGAWWHYLLPALCGAVVVGGRGWARTPFPRVTRLASAAGALLVGLLLATRSFRVPDAEDEATARAFYGFLRARDAPILAVWPEYAYFVLGQPVEMEGSSLRYFAAARAPGIELLLDRMRTRTYRMISVVSYLWPNDHEFERTLAAHYRIDTVCELGYFYGRIQFVLLLPSDDGSSFSPPDGVRCRSLAQPAHQR